MKKIALLILTLEDKGGTKILLELAKKLALWADVSIILPQGYNKTSYEIPEHVKIIEIKTPFKRKNAAYLYFLLRVIFYLKTFDIIVASFFPTAYPAFFASKIYKKKAFYFVQLVETVYGGLLDLFCHISYKLLPIITTNAFLEKEMKERSAQVVCTVTIGPQKIFLEYPQRNEIKYDLVYFARKEPWKNLNDFLEFLKKYESPLSIAVISQDQSLFEKIKKENSLNRIDFFKPESILEIIEIIDSSKLLLSTSLVEGFSLPPLEAMSRGKPVILYPSGGPEVYAKHYFNALFYKNIDQLIEAVEKLLKDKKLYEELSQNAYKTAKMFPLEDELEKISSFLKER